MCTSKKEDNHAKPLLPGREPFSSRLNSKFSPSRHTWLQEVGQADQHKLGYEGHLWVVKGKAYDLTSYLQSHPGGPEWLELTRGMDVTDLFITHHLDEKKAEAVLAKYYIKDVKHPGANDKFTYKEDGLYRTVKSKIVEACKAPNSTKATRGFQAISTLVLMTWMGCVGMAAKTGHWGWTMMAGFLLNTLFGIGHNFMHQAPNWWRYTVDLTWFSHWEWMVSHCISHHTYSNLELDFEIEVLEPWIFSMVNKPTNPILLPLYIVLLFASLGHVDAVSRVVAIAMGRQRPRPENLLPLLELGLFVWGLGWSRGFWHFFVMQSIPGILIAFSTLIVHHSDFAWSAGKHGGVLDFGQHIVMTTMDYHTTMPFIFSLLFCGLFNDHVIHHLFPTIDESRLPALKPYLVQSCQELKIPYNTYRYVDLFVATARTFMRRDKSGPIYPAHHPSLVQAHGGHIKLQ